MGKRWAHIGIEEEDSFEEIFFSSSANRIIVQVSRNGDPLRLESLFVRSPTERNYERLTPRSENLSYSDPVLPASAPFVFINVWKKTKMKGDMVGGDWIGLSSINLETRELKQIADEKRLAEALQCERAWVSRILNASIDGNTIYCSIAMDTANKIGYWLCTLSLSDGSISKVSELTDTFL